MVMQSKEMKKESNRVVDSAIGPRNVRASTLERWYATSYGKHAWNTNRRRCDTFRERVTSTKRYRNVGTGVGTKPHRAKGRHSNAHE